MLSGLFFGPPQGTAGPVDLRFIWKVGSPIYDLVASFAGALGAGTFCAMLFSTYFLGFCRQPQGQTNSSFGSGFETCLPHTGHRIVQEVIYAHKGKQGLSSRVS